MNQKLISFCYSGTQTSNHILVKVFNVSSFQQRVTKNHLFYWNVTNKEGTKYFSWKSKNLKKAVWESIFLVDLLGIIISQKFNLGESLPENDDV